MKDKLNVLHIRSSGAILGAENVILEIAKNSPEFDINPIIGAITHHKDPVPSFIKVAQKLNLKTILFKHRFILDFGCAGQIRRFVKKNKIDIIHCHGYKEDFYAVLSRSSVSKIATNHLWKKTDIKLKIYRIIDILMLRFFDEIIGVSDALVKEMKKLGIKNVSKISNGIDIEKFFPQSKSIKLKHDFKIDSRKIVIGMISSLTPEKNHRIVIESLVRLENPNIVLLIVGSGELETSLKRMVEEKKISDQVIFAGRRENIAEILSMIDVYLLPSLDEGLPMSLLEAMACGKAVIATRVGENENVLKNEENGLLVFPGSISQLIQAMQKVLGNEQFKNKIGQMAQQTVIERYSSKIMTKKYCDKYKMLNKKDIEQGAK